MEDRFEVAVGAGTMMAGSGAASRFPHRWTPGGVTVEAEFTGGHLLHLAAAGCVLNDLYREAATLGIELAGARVTAAGGAGRTPRGVSRYPRGRHRAGVLEPSGKGHHIARCDPGGTVVANDHILDASTLRRSASRTPATSPGLRTKQESTNRRIPALR
jgi:hypothetical protein